MQVQYVLCQCAYRVVLKEKKQICLSQKFLKLHDEASLFTLIFGL